MKTSYGTVLVLTMAAVILLTAPACLAVEKEGEKKAWLDDEPKRPHRWFELTDEKVEHIMSRLAESDPEKAKELAQLKEKDPEKFKVELKKVMRERFDKKHGMYDEKHRAGRMHHGRDMLMGGPGEPGGGRREMMRERMHDRHSEYLEWLEKNHPEEAEKLAELKDKKPELYRKHLRYRHKKYRKIMDAEEENPQLAEVLKQELELKIKRDKLLRKITGAADDKQKEKLVKKLKELISNRFDLIVKRKQIGYELLSKRLEKLKEELKQSEAGIEKWKAAKFREEKVKERLEKLMSRIKEFDWD